MKAMILAAGRGERMRPLTDQRPKPLLRAGGRSLIEWQLLRLREAGFSDIVINHAHLGPMIEAELGSGEAFGMCIRYSPETEALETAGGICQALPLLGDDPFLVLNGDIFCDFDLSRLASIAPALSTAGDLAHLVLVENPPHHPEGDFGLRRERIEVASGELLTFSGIGVYHPDLFGTLRAGEKAPLAPLLNAAIREHKVSGERHCGYWLDVGTPERLEKLDSYLTGASADISRD